MNLTTPTTLVTTSMIRDEFTGFWKNICISYKKIITKSIKSLSDFKIMFAFQGFIKSHHYELSLNFQNLMNTIFYLLSQHSFHHITSFLNSWSQWLYLGLDHRFMPSEYISLSPKLCWLFFVWFSLPLHRTSKLSQSPHWFVHQRKALESFNCLK